MRAPCKMLCKAVKHEPPRPATSCLGMQAYGLLTLCHLCHAAQVPNLLRIRQNRQEGWRLSDRLPFSWPWQHFMPKSSAVRSEQVPDQSCRRQHHHTHAAS